MTLWIHSVPGEEVPTPVTREEMEDGDRSVKFDASRLTSGVYFYKLTA